MGSKSAFKLGTSALTRARSSKRARVVGDSEQMLPRVVREEWC